MYMIVIGDSVDRMNKGVYMKTGEILEQMSIER